MRFLRFVAEETFERRGERLKEYTIALEVYGRPPSYDPQVDSLVRVQAAQLRNRLEQYYASEGRTDPIRIEIPKGGYQARFAVNAPAQDSSMAEPQAAIEGAPFLRRRQMILIAASAAVLVGVAATWMVVGAHRPDASKVTQTVAVLPFTDLRPGENQSSLGDGIAEELIQTLGRVPELRLVARGSSFKYRGAPDLRRVADELKVRSVVAGTVRRDGASLRVTAELIRAADGAQVWAATYDRQPDDLFAVAREIAQAIAGNLRAEPPHTGLSRAAAPAPEAYRRYMTGRYWRVEPTLVNLHRALGEFTAASAADPGYAKSRAAIAEVYARMYLAEVISKEPGAIPMSEAAAKARESAAKALELDDLVSEAHEASALVHIIDWDLAGAEREYQRALQLDRGNVRARFAYVQLCLNPEQRYDDAAQQLRAALEIDPVSANLITELGATYRLNSQAARAREQFWKALDLNPRAYGTRTNLAAADSAEGRFPAAIGRLEGVNADDPGDAWVMGQLGYAYAKAGRTADARRLLAGLNATSTAALHIAAIYAGLGEDDHAIDALEQGVARRSPSLLWLRTDFRFEPLRNHPRYTALLERLPK